MDTGCNPGECENDPKYTTPYVAPALPSLGGGGHEFVTSLPDVGTPGIEYIVMNDVTNCDTFRGSYAWNSQSQCWVVTSGAGGGALDTYTFEKTTTGWIAKKNNRVIFTYNDERITKLQGDVIDLGDDITSIQTTITSISTQVNTNTTNINKNTTDITNIKNDIYGDYLKNRIVVCEDSPLTLTVDETNPEAKKLIICFDDTDLGDKSSGAYEIKGELSSYLSTALLGTTPVNIINVDGLTADKVVIGETYLYDHQGTMGVVKEFDEDTGVLTTQTMTTSPGTRSGIRLGAVDTVSDLPATINAAEAEGWLTPTPGDFAYVRDDEGSLAEYLVQSIDASGNITWEFSHKLNAGNYVVDILTSDGVLIPKNADGTVTLPVNDRIKEIKLADGTSLPVAEDYSVTLPNFIKGAVLNDGTVLSVNAQSQIILPKFGTLMGVLTHDGVDLVVDTNGKVTLPRYVKGIKDSDGTLLQMDANDIITLPKHHTQFDTFEINVSGKDLATAIDSQLDLSVLTISNIIYLGSPITVSEFLNTVVVNRDLIFIHGTDGNEVTQEAIAWFESADDADNPTKLTFKVLAIPRMGSGGTGTSADAEVPEYTRDLHTGDEVKALELITYDNILYRATQDVTLTGIWSTDNTSFEPINSEPKNVYYNVYRDGAELGSIFCTLVDTDIPVAHNTNITYQLSKQSGSGLDMSGNNGIILKAGRRYEIEVDLTTQNTGTITTTSNVTDMYYFVKDSTNNINIATGMLVDRRDAALFGAGVVSCQYTVPSDGDITLQINTPSTSQYNNIAMKVRGSYSHISVHEIGRIVDPLAYLDAGDDSEAYPVGAVMPYFGNTPPNNYLACDGATYSIGSYPDLESFIVDNYGTINYFGGNGTTNYAVPDLRGEFLRGAGENSHTNTSLGVKEGSGATVGQHQQATTTRVIAASITAGDTIVRYTDNKNQANWDASLEENRYIRLSGTSTAEDSSPSLITVRPTNTSVNWCIKCKITRAISISGDTALADIPGMKHDIENLTDLIEVQSKNALTRAGNLPQQVVYNVDSGETEYKADNVVLQLKMKDLHTGGDATLPLTLQGASAQTTDEDGNTVPAHAGIMTSFQAEQLAALAEAYKNTTQGITLYEGSASVNYIDLSDDAWNYDHIVVVGEYISAGSSSFHQSVSAEFYPDKESGINTFQLNAIDIVANDVPLQTTLQDIWMLDQDGTELSLVSGMKSTVQGGTTTSLSVEPESTSIFTITKVVGYGKKV